MKRHKFLSKIIVWSMAFCLLFGAAPLTASAAGNTVKIMTSIVTKLDVPLKSVYVQSGKSWTVPIAVYNGITPAKASLASSLTWTSSNPKIVTVNRNGVVKVPKSVKKGKATITAIAASGKSVRLTVNVSAKAVKLNKATVSVSKSTMKTGQTRKLTVRLGTKKATGVKITFKSSKPSGLSVDKAGLLVAKKNGAYTITIKIGNVTVKKNIRVGGKPEGSHWVTIAKYPFKYGTITIDEQYIDGKPMRFYDAWIPISLAIPGDPAYNQMILDAANEVCPIGYVGFHFMGDY